MEMKQIAKTEGGYFGFHAQNVCQNEPALTDYKSKLRQKAETQIKAGEFGKADVAVQFNCNGNKVGIANFGMSTMLIENDVGVIVVRFSIFGSAVAEIRDFIKMGFYCLKDVLRNKDIHISNRGQAVLFSLEAFQGRYSSKIEDLCDMSMMGYSSVTVGVKKETASGYEIVKVNPKKALAAVDALARINMYYAPLEDVLAACLDMCAIGRMAGESTIDARKKPTQLVIVGIPGLERLQQIKLLSRQDLEIKIQWSEKIIGADFAPDRTSYRRKVVNMLGKYKIVPQDGDIKLSPEKGVHHFHGESWISKRKDEETQEVIKDIYVCDSLQRLRMQGVVRFMEWAKGISIMKDGDEIQKLTLLNNGEEVRRIEEVAVALDKGTGLVNAIRSIGREYQSATTAAAERERLIEVGANAMKLAPATKMAELAKIKANKKTVLDALTNKARVTFDAAEKILGKTISPEDRVRVIWAVVLENATNKATKKIEWHALGTLAQNLLNEEYLLWVLDAFKDDPRVQKCTWDKVHPVGIAKKMPLCALEMLNGKTVKLTNGEALFKGEPFLRGDDDLDGMFKLVVENKDGEVIVWATRDIKDLIVVPKGDPTKTIVKLRQVNGGDTTDNNNTVKAAMAADAVFLFKADINTPDNVIATMNNGVIKGIGKYNVPSSQAAKKPLCADIGSAYCGVMGTATYVEVIEYFDYQSGKPNNSGFIVLEHLRAATSTYKTAMQQQ